MGIEQLHNADPDAGRVEAGMDGQKFDRPERAQESSLPPERAEEMTRAQLEAQISGGRRLGMDERNWHAADHLANLAASGIVKTADNAIVEYRLGKDGTYDLKTWVSDVSAMTPDEKANQLAIEAAILTADRRETGSEAGAGALKWALSLRPPEASTVVERVSGLIGSFRNRLNINDKKPQTDAEKPDLRMAA